MNLQQSQDNREIEEESMDKQEWKYCSDQQLK